MLPEPIALLKSFNALTKNAKAAKARRQKKAAKVAKAAALLVARGKVLSPGAAAVALNEKPLLITSASTSAPG